MIAVTARASLAIRRVRAERQVPDQQAVRLSSNDEGIRLVFDAPRPNDVVIASGWEPVLNVDAAIADRFERAILDFDDETPGGAGQFTLRCPPWDQAYTDGA